MPYHSCKKQTSLLSLSITRSRRQLIISVLLHRFNSVLLHDSFSSLRTLTIITHKANHWLSCTSCRKLHLHVMLSQYAIQYTLFFSITEHKLRNYKQWILVTYFWWQNTIAWTLAGLIWSHNMVKSVKECVQEFHQECSQWKLLQQHLNHLLWIHWWHFDAVLQLPMTCLLFTLQHTIKHLSIFKWQKLLIRH